MIKKILYSILLIIVLLFGGYNNSYALDTYKECKTNHGGYSSDYICDNNYYLFYNLKGLHSSVEQVIKQSPSKSSELKDSLVDTLKTIKDDKIYNVDNICKYFFKVNDCNYDEIENYDTEMFVKSINLDGNLQEDIILKNFGDNPENIESDYNTLQKTINKFKQSLSEFTEDLQVIVSYSEGFSLKNVITGTSNMDYRILALTNPDKLEKLENKDIKHYKIGLYYIFRPFIYLTNDLFISLPFGFRYIANPYIIFGIIWYQIVYVIILLMLIFLVFSSLLYPIVRDTSDNRIKRKNMLVILMNSKEFNLFNYIFKIFFSNSNYSFKYDNGKLMEVLNEYRVPIIFSKIINQEKVGLGFMLVLWLFIWRLLTATSFYLIG